VRESRRRAPSLKTSLRCVPSRSTRRLAPCWAFDPSIQDHAKLLMYIIRSFEEEGPA